MSVTRRLQAPLSRLVASRALRAVTDGAHEVLRRARGAPHRVTFFHRVDDPASLLLAQVLPRFLEHNAVDLECRTIGEPAAEVRPEPTRASRWALRDATLVAGALGLRWPESPQDPLALAADAAKQPLVEAEDGPAAGYLELAVELGLELFAGRAPLAEKSVASVVGRLAANERRASRFGHFAGALLHYEGEWYHGLERLRHLERRLASLGLGDGASSVPRPPLVPPRPLGERLEVYVSLRSPYTWLALDRVNDLCRRWSLELVLKPVLPMVQRGLPVPLKKRIAIVRDARREADALGVPFGNVVDPLPGIERALAIWALAEQQGRSFAFVRSAAQAAFADGIELGSRAGLRLVTERAGLDWREARQALRDNAWRARVERHRRELTARGLWGVPTFALGDFVTWGQDRLWLLEHHLGERAAAAEQP